MDADIQETCQLLFRIRSPNFRGRLPCAACGARRGVKMGARCEVDVVDFMDRVDESTR